MALNETSLFAQKVKIILLGDPGVGKTSLICSLRDAPFNPAHEPTIGIDFFSRIVTKHSRAYKLQFWDTAGQEKFKCIIPSYVRNADIGIVVYDVANSGTWGSVAAWLGCFREWAPAGARVLVVGNKRDLGRAGGDQGVWGEQGHLEVSAKTGENISKLHQSILEMIPESEGSPDEQSFQLPSIPVLQAPCTPVQPSTRPCCHP